MDGQPGLLVGAQGVVGGRTEVTEGVEVVDQGDAPVLERVLRDVQDIVGLVQIVIVEAVR